MRYNNAQKPDQCWGKAFLYLAENKADVEENDANKYMHAKYLQDLKGTLREEHDKENLKEMYDGDKIKDVTTMYIGTMAKLIEFYNAQPGSKQIKIIQVDENGMKLKQKNNKLLKGFTYEQYQSLLQTTEFPEIAEPKKTYSLSREESEILEEENKENPGIGPSSI